VRSHFQQYPDARLMVSYGEAREVRLLQFAEEEGRRRKKRKKEKKEKKKRKKKTLLLLFQIAI
jgi:hypothetical protein